MIGDVGRGVFVRPGIPELMRDVAVPAADLVTPNHYELDLLAGTQTRSLTSVKDAVAAVQALGPRTVLTTSLVVEDTPEDAVDLLASQDGRHVRVRTPRLDLSVNGAGDAVAALFLAALAAGPRRRAGAVARRRRGARAAVADGGGGLARDPAGRGAGGAGAAQPGLRRCEEV